MNRKRLSAFVLLIALLWAVPANAFNEDAFKEKLLSFNQVAIPIAASAVAKQPSHKPAKGKGSGNSGGNFPWLTAEKINKQLEMLIQGIESAKGIATALAVIVNLYESDQISVEVAFTAVQILKLRALFLRVFITDGQSELEIMINVLQEHESDFGKQVKGKHQDQGQVKGKIGNQGFLLR